ncbi:MAG: glycosyltransferase family 2 protein [Pedobacter sp.]
MKRTTVVLVNYNGANDTEKCLYSLHKSSIVPRVIVVDNTPNDPELCKVILKYPNVHFISVPENLGFGCGNNVGIEWALSQTDCEFVFILNNDTTVEPGTIEQLERVLDFYPEAGIATPRIVFMNNPSILWYGGGEISWLRGSVVTPGFLGPSDSNLAMTSRQVSFASGCAMLARRELLKSIGGFDERLFMYEEDVELCLRTQKLGWEIRYEPTAIVSHVVQASSRGEQMFVATLSPLNSNLSFYTFHLFRNRFINMRLHAKGKNRLIFIVGFSLFLLKTVVSFARHKRWDGIAAIVKGWQSYRSCFASCE